MDEDDEGEADSHEKWLERREIDRARHFIWVCEKSFLETGNSYFACSAIATAASLNLPAPQWAMALLLKSVQDAVSVYGRSGGEFSVDRALGLRLKRGQRRREDQALTAMVENNAFTQVHLILRCFDISIPEACEIVYRSVAYLFAHSCHFANGTPAGSGRLPSVVLDKIRLKDWWSITCGDRLGYGLENFIDRYYRVGTKQQSPKEERSELEESSYFSSGYALMRLMPEFCTYRVVFENFPGAHGVAIAPSTVSALACLPKRPEFQWHVEREDFRNEAVLIQGISTQ
tara:strand:+ start:508 stop:1371 length:864 start_codon:yes stop_codon:yes gene_type:complete